MLIRIAILHGVLALASLVSAQTQPASSGGIPAPGLSVERAYNGVNRPGMIVVTSPRSFGTVTLQLMDFDGQPLAAPVEVHPGRVDLSAQMPAIWGLRRTAYLQLLDLAVPVGPALVLQPMLSRMVPKTEVRTHPVTGNPSTRITGWIDENDPSMLTPPPPPPPPERSRTPTSPLASPTAPPPGDAPPLPGGGNPASTRPAVVPASQPEPEPPPPPRERLFTGLRIWSETDVLLQTSKGDIRICLKPDEAPNTAWNFLELARDGFYRDIQFHRIVPLTTNGLPFVIQAGDPTATGDGGPGYWLPIEDSQLPHDFGVISMARSDDPDSNGSQFFICLSREGTARLDGQYCAFGYAVDGATVIKAIAEVELADIRAGRPAEAPLIRDAQLVPAPPRMPGIGRPDERVSVEQARQPATRPTGRVPR